MHKAKTDKSIANLFNLKDKTALVTGGGGWLGSAISEALAELKAHVFIASRNTAKAEITASQIMKSIPNAQLTVLPLSIDTEDSVIECIRSIEKSTGRLDILVNNAFSGKANSLEETNLIDWQNVLNTGLTGCYSCIKAAIPLMKKNGGSIINIASMYGIVSPNFSIYQNTPFNSSPAYGSAKAALLQLTRYCACDLAKYKIRVNAISPGPFPTAEVQENIEFMDALTAKNPMGRIGQPWELKGPISFLATEASSYVTGQNLVVDGGWTAW